MDDRKVEVLKRWKVDEKCLPKMPIKLQEIKSLIRKLTQSDSAFVVRCLDSIVSPDSIAEISRL